MWKQYQVVLEQQQREADSLAGPAKGEGAREAVLPPVPPADGGAAALQRAAAAGTPFEEAAAALQDLSRRGLVLDTAPEGPLAGLLSKASTAEHVSAALGVLRTNHLAQAWARRHDQHLHDTLYDSVVQACRRSGSAAALLELWDSLYEHGVNPSGQAAAAAVRCAVELRDGAAAASLAALAAQYDYDLYGSGGGKSGVPAPPAEVVALLPDVRALVEKEGGQEAVQQLRNTMARLGYPA